MIVITIDLWKRGDSRLKTRLGTIHITNDGTGIHSSGNYVVQFWGRNREPGVDRRLARRDVVISGFPRLRLTVFYLLRRALVAAGY